MSGAVWKIPGCGTIAAVAPSTVEGGLVQSKGSGRRSHRLWVLGSAMTLLAVACAGGSGPADREAVRNFIRPPADLDSSRLEAFRVGRALFGKRWTLEEGLGPAYDARSCLICHPRGGGGRPAEVGRSPAENASMVVRLPQGDHAYGRQLQRRFGDDQPGEGQVSLAYDQSRFIFADGEAVTLRTPRYQLTGMKHGPLGVRPTVVIAPKVAGVGLLEAVPEASLRAGADPDDRNGDGVSGRLAVTEDGRIGRFGWRAEAVSVEDQAARAFALDMGLSTPVRPGAEGDCETPACRRRLHGEMAGRIEVEPARFAELVRFTRMIEPPPPGPKGPAARRGSTLFARIGCAACHRPSFVTGAPVDGGRAGRRIWPYSDLLLHDMGQGLADGNSSEWRTAPLWGVGLRAQVQGEAFYLHDGRARSVTEAILWHGGEAEGARRAFTGLSRQDRQALLAFLATL
jgi:CxxC motif-containing protein (DUF1111 family)